MNGVREHEDTQRLNMRHFVMHLASIKGKGLPPTLDQYKGEVRAKINHGRWIVECPAPGCAGAVVVSSIEPFFFCPYCGNATNDHQWLRVIFPADKERIEQVLMRRPFKANRNWASGETVAALIAENAKMKVK